MTNSNQNNAGLVTDSGIARTFQILNVIIPAGVNLPVSQAGESFYIVACNGTVSIRPSGGVYNDYYTGTGNKVDSGNLFANLDVKNNNTFSVSLSLWVGFGEYIDRRLIPISDVFRSVVYPTYGIPSSLTNILIPDLSGNAIVDQNGKRWLALNRLSIQMTNFDGVNPLQLRNKANTLGVIACLSNTSLIVDFAGDFQVTLGTTPINALISETYNCISPTF